MKETGWASNGSPVCSTSTPHLTMGSPVCQVADCSPRSTTGGPTRAPTTTRMGVPAVGKWADPSQRSHLSLTAVGPIGSFSDRTAYVGARLGWVVVRSNRNGMSFS
ncbi:hypothetical protein GW17_00021941 [Ensete ventricosum]|nr:hypothetical protein GW17_00021941 [Ensete ventricosum]